MQGSKVLPTVEEGIPPGTPGPINIDALIVNHVLCLFNQTQAVRMNMEGPTSITHGIK